MLLEEKLVENIFTTIVLFSCETSVDSSPVNGIFLLSLLYIVSFCSSKRLVVTDIIAMLLCLSYSESDILIEHLLTSIYFLSTGPSQAWTYVVGGHSRKNCN